MLKILSLLTMLMYFVPTIIKVVTDQFIFSYEKKLNKENIINYNIRKIIYTVVIIIEFFIIVSSIILTYKYNITQEHNTIMLMIIIIILNVFIFYKTRNYYQFSDNINYTLWQRFYNMFLLPLSILILLFTISSEYKFVFKHLNQLDEFKLNNELKGFLIFISKYISWFFILGLILPTIIKLDIWYKKYKNIEDQIKKIFHNFLTNKKQSNKKVKLIEKITSNIILVIENRIRKVLTVIVTLLLLKFLNPYTLLKYDNLNFIFNIFYLPLISLFFENIIELYFIVEFKYIDEINLFFQKKDQKIWYLRNYKENKKFITFKADEIFIDNDSKYDLKNYEEELAAQFPFISNVKITKRYKTYSFKVSINKIGGY